MSERKIYIGKLGKTYTALDPPLGKGGEGAVFKIQEDHTKVIKVFWEENRTPEREKKLTSMTDMHLPDNLTAQNTWPVDLVYENDEFAGFVMKAVTDSIPVNRLYMEEYKKSCTYDKRVFIAKNICAAVHSVHIAGQVVGDLNPKNVCVNPDTGMVTLVDTNSYHITDPKTGEVHRCEVGLPEYLAKEIQLTLRKGTTLKDAPLPTFTKETDNFALAVHIFALLMNGCHPYACARDIGADIDSLSTCKSSVALPQPIENICTGNFTFYNPVKGTRAPMYAPDYNMLPDNIRQLFTRAFVNGSDDPCARPDAVEWFKALDGLLHNLKKCKEDDTHIFPSNAVTCPWCLLNSGEQSSIKISSTHSQSDYVPLSDDELKILGEGIKKTAGGKKNIKSIICEKNCIVLELKNKQKDITLFSDKAIYSIVEDENKVKYLFNNEGDAEGVAHYINKEPVKEKNNDKKKSVNKKLFIIIPIAAGAAAAAIIPGVMMSGKSTTGQIETQKDVAVNDTIFKETTATGSETEQTTMAETSTTKVSTTSNGEKNVFTYGTAGYSADLLNNGTNPHDGYMGWSCLRYGVGETLFKFTDEMTLEPWLATSYEFTDDTHCKITLRDDVTFSSGRKMDGEAVKECLDDLIAVHDRAPGELKIKEITADVNTVTIETEEPCPALINYLSDPYGCIIDMQVPEKNSIVAGTGPFICKKVTDDEMDLVKNENYWGGKVKSDEVIIKGISDGDTLTAALLAGEVDAAYGLPYASYFLFEGDNDYTICSCETSRQFFGKMNYNSSIMQDEAVRKAVAMSIDKEGFVTYLLSGLGATSVGPFPESFYFGDNTVTAPSYDPEGAKQALEEAGWKVGSDGIREKDGTKLSINWLTYPSRQELPLLAESAQATLKEIGIDVQINNTNEHKTFWKGGDYDIYVSSMVTAPTGDPEYFFTTHALTGAPFNYEGYSNAKLDELAAELNKTFDETKRGKIATEMSQIILDDFAYVFASHLQMNIVKNAGVSGLEIHPCDFYEINQDTVVE